MHRIKNFCRVAETEYALSTDNLNLLYYTLPKNFSDAYRSYDAPRLCTILEGKKKVSVNQSENFVYKKEQFILLPPNSNVHMTMPETTKALVYEFGDQIIHQVSQKVSDSLQADLDNDICYSSFALDCYSNRTAALHHRIQDILIEQDDSMEFLIDLTCQEMVYELMKAKGCKEIIHHQNNHPISRAIRMLNSADGLQMNVSELAEEAGMSLSSFSQKFKLITDVTPSEYLTRLRLSRAEQLLKRMSVTETAYEVGYDNISYFIRLFKQKNGMTPKQYKSSRV